MTLAALWVLALAAPSGSGHRPDFAVPKTFALKDSVLPVEYLRTYPVSDPAAKLSTATRPKICRLVRAAHAESLRKYRQDYPLGTQSAFFRLLANNYPSVKSATGEHGRIVFLGKLADAVCTGDRQAAEQ